MKPFKVPQASGQNKTQCPAGTHIARLYQLIDIGTQTVTWAGEEKIQRQIILTWELPEELHVFREERGAEPFVISRTYTLSMHPQSRLRQDLEAWRGEKFSDKEVEDFDLSSILGAPCLLTVTHDKKPDGRVYANMTGISKLMKSMQCPEPINKPVGYQIEERETGQWNDIPKWIKDKIKSSAEWNQEAPVETATSQNAPVDNEIPF